MVNIIYEQRKKIIIQQLNAHKTVSNQDLLAEIDVSESTLRRDLQMMEDEGLLRRTHGGATQVQPILTEQNMQDKIELNTKAKIVIATYASSLVNPNTQIYVDAGTTTLELIKHLPTNKNIQIVTNGLDHALVALQRNLSVTLLGGQVKAVTHAVAGITSYQQLQKLHFDLAFIGMNGLSINNGLTTTNIDEAALKEVAMNQSQNVRILVDDSKLEQVYEFKVDVPKRSVILLNELQLEDEVQLKKHFNLNIIRKKGA